MLLRCADGSAHATTTTLPLHSAFDSAVTKEDVGGLPRRLRVYHCVGLLGMCVHGWLVNSASLTFTLYCGAVHKATPELCFHGVPQDSEFVVITKLWPCLRTNQHCLCCQGFSLTMEPCDLEQMELARLYQLDPVYHYVRAQPWQKVYVLSILLTRVCVAMSTTQLPESIVNVTPTWIGDLRMSPLQAHAVFMAGTVVLYVALLLEVVVINSCRAVLTMCLCLWFAVFASLVAPFGGFFASGFKRAFKIKVEKCACAPTVCDEINLLCCGNRTLAHRCQGMVASQIVWTVRSSWACSRELGCGLSAKQGTAKLTTPAAPQIRVLPQCDQPWRLCCD